MRLLLPKLVCGKAPLFESQRPSMIHYSRLLAVNRLRSLETLSESSSESLRKIFTLAKRYKNDSTNYAQNVMKRLDDAVRIIKQPNSSTARRRGRLSQK